MGYIQQAHLEYLARRGELDKLLATHTKLGYHPDTGDELFIPDVDRYSGMYVPGKQGFGKSSFIETQLYQDMVKGNAIVVIDPHGDLVRDVIAQAPQSRMHQIYLLDMADEEHPFGVNLLADALFETGMDKSRALARVTNIFNVIWPETATQANLPIYLNAAIITLLSNPGSTLVDMLRLFTSPDFRHQLLLNVTDQDVHQQWQEYETGGKASQNEPAALVRRLKLLFMGRDIVKNIVGQRQTSINFRKAIEEKQIILIRLPVNEADEDAKLIGTFLMSQLTYAIFSFGDMEPSKRPGVTIAVDEFQNFTTKDTARIFTEGRKFGARLIVAHQHRSQVPEFLQDATMTARTVVVFQAHPDDTTDLARLFHSGATTIKPEDITENPVKHLMVHPSDVQILRAFVEYYLQPLKGYRSGKQIKVTNPGSDVYGGFLELSAAFMGPKNYKPTVVEMPDPTDALNLLLIDAMRTGNPDLPIHPDIPRGFCNSGRGFLAVARGCWNDPALQPGFQWPLHLVSGDQWLRMPESPREEFYFFLFNLRLVLRHMAANPIGEASASKPSDVAHALASLPIRHAFVHASDGAWYMKTHDTPEAVKGEALQARLFFVREQTRQTYCHPRQQIEQYLSSKPAADNPAVQYQPTPLGAGDVAGWGEADEP